MFKTFNSVMNLEMKGTDIVVELNIDNAFFRQRRETFL